jgi:RHS repeat-associated protein
VFSGGRGHPAAQYCANLGHLTDAETGPVYMRARYYEPWTGRFLSEDPAMDGTNWYVYCGNDPVGRVNRDGKLTEDDESAAQVARIVAISLSLSVLMARATCATNPGVRVLASSGLVFLATWFGMTVNHDGEGRLGISFVNGGLFVTLSVGLVGSPYAYWASETAKASPAASVVDFYSTYAAIIGLFLSLESLMAEY